MTKTLTYCDRCKLPVPDDSRTELVVEDWAGPSHHRRESIDLCGPCTSALVTFLNAPAMTHPPLRSLSRSAGRLRVGPAQIRGRMLR